MITPSPSHISLLKELHGEFDMNEPFLIVQALPYLTKHDGDYRYRIGQPAEAMANEPGVSVVNVGTTSPYLFELAMAADVLILHLMNEPDMLPVLAERNRLGRPTVYEISDNFMALPDHIASMFRFQDSFPLSLNFQLIRSSTAIQGVSGILLEKYGFLKETRLLFENHVLQPGPPPRKPEGDIIIGWGGSMGHTEDLKWIAPAMAELCRSRQDVRFHVMGNQEQFEQICNFVGDDELFQYHPPGSLEDYFSFLDTLDIGLAPLLNTPFNICRSDVKFVEYASRGVVPVLSNIGPYQKHARHDENALLFDDPQEMLADIVDLVEDHERIFRIKTKAYQYACSHRIESKNAPFRVETYRALAEGRTPEAKWPMDKLQRLSPESMVYGPKSSQSEEKLIQGLVLKSEERETEAFEAWECAVAEPPLSHTPCLVLAGNLVYKDQDKAKTLVLEALKRKPDSLRAILFLGELLEQEDRTQAQETFERAIAVFQDFAPAWGGIARLRMQEGRIDEAAALLDRALRGNPFDAGVAFELGKAFIELQKHETAFEAFQIAVELLPDKQEYTVELVKAMLKTGNPSGAMKACQNFLLRNPENDTIGRISSAISKQYGGVSNISSSMRAQQSLH